MAQSQNLKRRIEKIERELERELEPEKGACLRFPDGQGGFIEAPGCRSLVDVMALVGIGKDHASNFLKEQPKATKNNQIPKNRGAK